MAEIASGWGAHSASQPVETPSVRTSDDLEFLREVALSINRHTLAYMADRNRRDGNPFAAECIMASAVACQVFPRLGVRDVEPVALELFALSRTAYEKVIDRKEITGSWWRSASPDSEVAGHIGVIVSGALVDATAGQMAFPSSGLYAPSVVVISRESMEGRQEGQFVTLACDGGDTYLLY
ncbi:MAG: hypothetical protein HOQ05_13055, partial [Corynebacteriales bacterium]|nr:hypothetical protein [Mycobacteriales bacterium]